jgi:hypothetical protein
MRYIKKSSLNASEVAKIRRRSDDYIWAVLDTAQNRIVIGDESLVELRDTLIRKFRSYSNNIYGIGLDLRTGEIVYAKVINRMNSNYRALKDIPQNIKNRIETMVAYYFERFEPFRPKTYRTHQAHAARHPSC